MSKHTNHQVINKDGKPVFAVIPYKEYLELVKEKEPTIPHEVMKIFTKEKCSILKAWRLHKKLTQKDVAKKMGMSQPAYQSLETSEGKYQKQSIEKLAAALEIKTEQIF
ncbi:MAG: helix-turn-helix transcriptional regulator [Cellvibrionaceae bacterium]